jgi:AraC-like DNA-binding protein
VNQYREFAPSARFAEAIECIWTSRHDEPGISHRVMPDGCADILLTRGSSGAILQAIGPMTVYRDYTPAECQFLVGVRFRPGMWRAAMGVPGERITDGVLPLEELWGNGACELLDRLAGARSARECAGLFEQSLRPAVPVSPVQKAVAWMERLRGHVSVDGAAGRAGLSPRQFRRLCLEQTGLTPKFLARVLRFRHALRRLEHGRETLVDVALACGYYDQAHCIRDVREFSGRTPGAVVADFSNPRPAAAA